MAERADTGVAQPTVVHGTTVAQAGRALLITGRAGSGKSALAVSCIGLGAELVADDRTILTRKDAAVLASAPAAIAGLMEVRGVGLMRLPHTSGVPIAAKVDLDTLETQRLPPVRTTVLLGATIDLFWRVEGAHFASALLLYLAGARFASIADPDLTR